MQDTKVAALEKKYMKKYILITNLDMIDVQAERTYFLSKTNECRINEPKNRAKRKRRCVGSLWRE